MLALQAYKTGSCKMEPPPSPTTSPHRPEQPLTLNPKP